MRGLVWGACGSVGGWKEKRFKLGVFCECLGRRSAATFYLCFDFIIARASGPSRRHYG